MHKLLHYISCKTEAKQHKPGPTVRHKTSKKILGDLVLKRDSGPMRVRTLGVLSPPVLL